MNIKKTLDGPAVVYVNIFVRSISKIDDVVMVSESHSLTSSSPPYFYIYICIVIKYKNFCISSDTSMSPFYYK